MLLTRFVMRRFLFSPIALIKNSICCNLLLISFYVQAQHNSEFALRAGYLYSITKVDKIGDYTIFIPDVKAKPGFYIGGQYQLRISKRFMSRSEINFQNKGIITDYDYDGTLNRVDFNYIGITQMGGFTPLTNLTLLIGPEFNVSLNNKPNQKSTNAIECGIAMRCSYQFNKIAADFGYFVGLNEIRKLPSMGNNKYYNRNLQVGISYTFK